MAEVGVISLLHDKRSELESAMVQLEQQLMQRRSYTSGRDHAVV